MNSLAGAVALTKTGGILGPIAGILGLDHGSLFRFTSTFGIENIGLCIILFTLGYKGSDDAADHQTAEIIQTYGCYAA